MVFEAFYWIINFGSFFASLLMPLFLRYLGPAVAFDVPGALMFISTAILWAGRKQYVMIPPAPPNPHSFLRVSRDAIAAGVRGQILAGLAIASVIGSFVLTPQFGFVIAACLALVGLIAFGGLGIWLQLDCIHAKHPVDAIVGVRSVLRVLVCSHWLRRSGRCSIRKHRPGCCKQTPWQSQAGFSPLKCRL